MFKNGMEFISQASNGNNEIFAIENEAYQALRRAHDRFLSNKNLFTAKALTVASDKYREIVEKHEARGM